MSADHERPRNRGFIAEARPVAERFWEKVIKTEGCWGWKASHDKDGYPKLRSEKINGSSKMCKASRICWEIHFGEIPQGMFVCHQCDNPRCINPEHLFLGTRIDNMQDCVNKKRHRNTPKKGEANKRSKLTDKDVLQIRSMSGTTKQKDIAKIFNVAQCTVSKIVLGLAWRHI